MLGWTGTTSGSTLLTQAPPLLPAAVPCSLGGLGCGPGCAVQAVENMAGLAARGRFHGAGG